MAEQLKASCLRRAAGAKAMRRRPEYLVQTMFRGTPVLLENLDTKAPFDLVAIRCRSHSYANPEAGSLEDG
ncbi:hypothetical protein ColTof4_00599 [Colletotrichum tofieldiae]|nr:hypothetical protein ColTof3_07806 [Colletotrichum tofieldiae]GKT68176.1 hypothetical protein ColTof4_00599 [Colletotrichum tofieldiae]GKT90825.1 hypothetical protein Ct61P_08675 [Colletotrichum tofieldiae]